MRGLLSVIVALAALATPVPRATAQQWVTKMVGVREHDFGTVARGSDTVYRFAVKNVYKQSMRLVNIRSSCGCTTPTLDTNVLESGEVGHVVATFNTRTFQGVHSATLTLRVEWRDDSGILRAGETQMRVHGNIRGDVVFQPGGVKFAGIPAGKSVEQTVRVRYAGRGSWRVNDVRSASEHLEVELLETQRDATHVMYDLKVRLKESAPPGYLREQLVLVTNDRSNPRITLDVEGRVRPNISIAPESLTLGEVELGGKVSKRIVVRGEQPFRVVDVACEDQCFTFSTPEKVSQRHFITVTFAPKDSDVGNVKRQIHISTDLGEDFGAVCTAYATIKASGNEPATASRSDGSVAQQLGR